MILPMTESLLVSDPEIKPSVGTLRQHILMDRPGVLYSTCAIDLFSLSLNFILSHKLPIIKSAHLTII